MKCSFIQTMFSRVIFGCVSLLAAVALCSACAPCNIPGLKEIGKDFLDEDMPRSYDLSDGEEFDYIVVGAGGGGTAAASRLALAGHNVLLVEAGGDPDPISKIPIAAVTVMGHHLDWQYKTIPNNKSCKSLRGEQCRFTRGKCLGGSTSINFMMYVRGNRQDYELNLTGWTWNEIKPFFLIYEGLQDLDKLPSSSTPYHNVSGTMRIQFFHDENPWHKRIIEGFKSLGFPRNYDVNAESQIGVTQTIGYMYKNERMSTARGYLTRNDVKAKLKVAKRTRCTGVIINEDKEAEGVTVVSDLTRETLRLRAKHEVVLSAGAVGNPQLLMLSGVGPSDHLNSLGIPVHSDLPVGDNMSDHVLAIIFIAVDKTVLSVAHDAVNLVEWVACENSTLATNLCIDVPALANTKCYDTERRKLMNDSAECELPTTHFFTIFFERGLLTLTLPIFRQSFPLNDDVTAQVVTANLKYSLLFTSCIVLNPYSRGTVRLASTDPLEDPAIYPNYLDDDRDVDEMLRAITVMEHLVDTPAYKERNAFILHLKLPGCPSYENDRDGYWRCYVRHVTYSVMHAAGTTALGTVLDERMRVKGVQGLRVGDLGAMPVVPHGNTAAAAIALGERVAHFILEDKQ